MTYVKRCLQHFARFFPLYILCLDVIPLRPFLGIGKKSVSKLFKTKGSQRFEKLALMDGQYKDEVQTAIREFVALLYDPSNKERRYHFCLNKLRSKLALRKCNTIGKLPPCEDAFKQHVKWAM